MIETNLFEVNNIRGIVTRGKSEDQIVICVPGFEQSGTTSPKFKLLADKLASQNISCWRYDLTGCGLSDGDFGEFTVKQAVQDLEMIIAKANNQDLRVNIVAHSLGACIAAQFMVEQPDFNLSSLVLLAPAFDQANLLRYWHVKSLAKAENLEIPITWDNYLEYYDEDVYRHFIHYEQKFSKYSKLHNNYHLENFNIRYTVANHHNVLHIHGDKDNDVPLVSVLTDYTNQLIVTDGDHHLEKPAMREQWLNAAVDFIKL